MNPSLPSPRLTPENLAICLRQGCYLCTRCQRLGYIGRYFEPEQTPPCEHCKRRALTWYPPVLAERRN